jgi:hypothetical protein
VPKPRPHQPRNESKKKWPPLPKRWLFREFLVCLSGCRSIVSFSSHKNYVLFSVSTLDKIDGNIDCPEDSREVYVFAASELPSVTEKTDYHHGYIVLKEIDIEPYWDEPEDDHYKFRIFSTEAKLLLTFPSIPHAIQSDPISHQDCAGPGVVH